jgi:predicted acetyltransferase
MNARLLEDENHRLRIGIPELVDRMRSWLLTDYEAVLFEEDEVVLGYVLYQQQSDSIFVRQFFIERTERRRGLGRRAFELLAREVWPADERITVDVLAHNAGAKAFWNALGFVDYATTLERLARPSAPRRSPRG